MSNQRNNRGLKNQLTVYMMKHPGVDITCGEIARHLNVSDTTTNKASRVVSAAASEMIREGALEGLSKPAWGVFRYDDDSPTQPKPQPQPQPQPKPQPQPQPQVGDLFEVEKIMRNGDLLVSTDNETFVVTLKRLPS